MNRQQIKTDNSYLNSKINLRVNHLPDQQSIKVLDCFAGRSRIWKEIKKKSNKNINVVGIDRISYGSTLKGDNVKYLKGMNLDKYDIIDLDAYGVPFKQLEIIFKKKYKGILFITFVQSIFGRLPVRMIEKIGYTRKMIKKCPTLFNRNGIEKFKQYLAINGIKRIIIINKNNKKYLYIPSKPLQDKAFRDIINKRRY